MYSIKETLCEELDSSSNYIIHRFQMFPQVESILLLFLYFISQYGFIGLWNYGIKFSRSWKQHQPQVIKCEFVCRMCRSKQKVRDCSNSNMKCCMPCVYRESRSLVCRHVCETIQGLVDHKAVYLNTASQIHELLAFDSTRFCRARDVTRNTTIRAMVRWYSGQFQWH